jgi:putative membrane protein
MKITHFLASLLLALLPTGVFAQQEQAQSTMPQMTEEQIAEVIQAANAAEIQAAQMAKTKSANGEVKGYAEHMISAHNDNSEKLSDLQKKFKMRPAHNEMAQKISTDAKSQMTSLKQTPNKEFETAYMQSQVKMHQQLLNDLDQKFIPQARNPEFKSFLQETRTHVQEHLSKAETLQSTQK